MAVLGLKSLDRPLLGRYNDDRVSSQKIDASPSSHGFHMKNQVYRGSQFEVVLAAWVNLEAGL